MLQLHGTAAYLWNPLILFELAGEGHNDAVMLFFVVAALAACAAQRPVTSLIAQSMGALTKYVSLLFIPPQLVYLWRTRNGTGRFALEICIATVIAAAIAAILYAPFWAGLSTFEGLLERGAPLSSASPFGGINWMLRRSPFAAFAGPITIAVVSIPSLMFVVWASLRVKDVAGLAQTLAWISVLYVLFASPDYWPWHACMPVALILIADSEGWLWFALLLSFVARLCAPLELMREHGFLSMILAKGLTTGLGATLPLVVLLVWLFRSRDRGRSGAIFA
jgi:hypothetical protein